MARKLNTLGVVAEIGRDMADAAMLDMGDADRDDDAAVVGAVNRALTEEPQLRAGFMRELADRAGVTEADLQHEAAAAVAELEDSRNLAAEHAMSRALEMASPLALESIQGNVEFEDALRRSVARESSTESDPYNESGEPALPVLTGKSEPLEEWSEDDLEKEINRREEAGVGGGYGRG